MGQDFLQLLKEENKHRVEELQMVADKLELPETYTNKYRTKEYQTKVKEYLQTKLEEYNTYANYRLKQMCRLTDSNKPHERVLNQKQKRPPKRPHPEWKLQTDEMEVVATFEEEEDIFQEQLEEQKR